MSPLTLPAERGPARPLAMNHHKYTAIAHRDHDYCNPLSAAKFERLLDLLPLEATSRVLDLGCGRAELALRIIERFGSTVLALDHSPYMLDAARERAEWTGALGRLHLDDADIRDFRADPETFHLSVMLDAAGIAGGMPGICRQLRTWTCSGGYVLVGIGYWRRKPSSELVALLGGRERELLDHPGNVQSGIDAGLVPMHAVTATEDEWDEYEWKFCRSVERYAREQPDDPDVAAMLDRARRWRDAYLRWGRDALGFAVYLFYRPGARIG
jgi:SAM-dependent methyltransferase